MTLLRTDVTPSVRREHAALEDGIASAVCSRGFVFLRAGDAGGLLTDLDDSEQFAASWNDLGLDEYMGDGGAYRRRRFASFAVSAVGVIRKPHGPHYQTVAYNHLNGGIDRWFEPVRDEIAAHPITTALLASAGGAFDRLAPGRSPWHAEMHQFRIEASRGSIGRPTPEGMHRDGVDYVLVLLVGRQNVASGVTMLADDTGQVVGEFTLSDPGDMVFLDDQRLLHSVTEIRQQDPGQPGLRDVLVLTFRRVGDDV